MELGWTAQALEHTVQHCKQAQNKLQCADYLRASRVGEQAAVASASCC